MESTREIHPTSSVSSVHDTLKLLLALEPTTGITVDAAKDAIIRTLSSGLDYPERTKMLQAVAEAERRAAIAEWNLAVAANSDTVPQNHTQQKKSNRSRSSTASASANPDTYQPNKYYGDHCSTSPSAPLLIPKLNSEYSKQSTTYNKFEAAPPTAPIARRLSLKQLDSLFRPAQGGRAKSCRICLALVTYAPYHEFATLVAHAEGMHPTEYISFSEDSDETNKENA
ncbi:hypothetical protein C8R43DRAFT_987336 [Mycena crocata]|nr:hypothetical protein C8R43DRAFT_987336 [Mycena crocata]